MSIAISVENLSKAYRIVRQSETSNSLVGSMLSFASAPVRNFRQLASLNTFGKLGEDETLYWALRDVSFEVNQGDVVGIIGRNGAGKSTLLKILSRITQPTTGRAVLRGRVSSLLEVGTGFHQELSGRENVYMNGTILGMKKREIDSKFDEIVEFSGIEKFLDTPVKRYSSGMKVRLAFAVAAHLEPEILIIDEVLAVGDFEFQSKCIGKMEAVAKGGRTVIFVSHDMGAIQRLCNHCLILSEGRVLSKGPTADVVSSYLGNLQIRERHYDVDLSEHASRTTKGKGILKRFRITNANGDTLLGIEMGTEIFFEVECESAIPLDFFRIAIHISDSKGVRVMTCHSLTQSRLKFNVKGTTITRCRIESLRLMPGFYHINLGARTNDGLIDGIDPALAFEVLARDIYGTGYVPKKSDGVFAPEVEWSVIESNGPIAAPVAGS